jgi:predicted dehydrogenase
MDKMRIGIIGFGIMGRTYADAIATFDDAVVTAVAEVGESLREQATVHCKCPVYASFGEMFKAEKMDMAIIAVPDFLHRDPTIAAAEAGVNILLEKPFAMNMGDADAMMAAIEKAGVQCTVEFSNRWVTHYVQAREKILDGKLGEVLSIASELNDTIFVPTEMLSWAAKSSPAWFLMSHTADLTCWVAGKKPARVFATGTKKLLPARNVNTWDVIEALVEYDDGAVGRLTNGWVLANAFPLVYEFKSRFIGSHATIDIQMHDQGMHFVTHDRYEHPHVLSGHVRGRYVGSLFNFLRDTIRDMREGRQLSVTARDGYDNAKFICAVHRSIETGEPVKL